MSWCAVLAGGVRVDSCLGAFVFLCCVYLSGPPAGVEVKVLSGTKVRINCFLVLTRKARPSSMACPTEAEGGGFAELMTPVQQQKEYTREFAPEVL